MGFPIITKLIYVREVSDSRLRPRSENNSLEGAKQIEIKTAGTETK